MANQRLDKLKEFQSLCDWAKRNRILKFKFAGNEVEFSPLAFQGEVQIRPGMSKEGLKAISKEKREQDFEEILTWSSAP